jgi:hypothetical protein
MGKADIRGIINSAADAAADKVIKALARESERRETERHDRRLNNTRLLLGNLRAFKQMIAESVFDVREIDAESALDVLAEMMSSGFTDAWEVRVESIKRNVARTITIVSHVEKMLDIYRVVCEQSYKPEDLRRWRMIVAKYVDGRSTAAIAEAENVDVRTAQRDINSAVNVLAVLIFGIDGLNR